MSAETLREWRVRIGLTACALARLAGINAGLLSLHESGQRNLSSSAVREVMLCLQSVEVLCQILPVRPDLRDVEGLRKVLQRLHDGEMGSYKRLHEEELAARRGIVQAGEDEESTPRVIDTAYVHGAVPQDAKS